VERGRKEMELRRAGTKGHNGLKGFITRRIVVTRRGRRAGRRREKDRGRKENESRRRLHSSPRSS